MAGFEFDVSQVTRLAVKLDALPLKTGPALNALVTHHTALLDLRMKRHASGRPGPNVITGDFRRSITHEIHGGALKAEGVAGSGAPQAARLEFGFFGTDSLGRSYAQAPLPWARPAADEAEPEFVAGMERLAADIDL